MGFSIYGKTAEGVTLEQTTPEEKEAALRLLEQVEADAKLDDGKPVFELDETTQRHVEIKMNSKILSLIKAFDTRRQMQEEVRANHRNFNRMMTLVVAIVLGFVVTYGLSHMGFPLLGITFPPFVKAWGPYSFVITVTLDFFLALYALIKHY